MVVGLPSPPRGRNLRNEFFESRIRPVLVAQCYSCHSGEAKELKARCGWTRARLDQSGDSGPAIVAGKPDQSTLIAALKYESLEMPPDGKLPPT